MVKITGPIDNALAQIIVAAIQHGNDVVGSYANGQWTIVIEDVMSSNPFIGGQQSPGPDTNPNSPF